jgi:hypothetical protein
MELLLMTRIYPCYLLAIYIQTRVSSDLTKTRLHGLLHTSNASFISYFKLVTLCCKRG